MTRVIDAHQHVWDSAADYVWMTDEFAVIRRPFAPDDLRSAMSATGVERTILVQTRSSLEETRGFLALAAVTPFIAGVVGWVDLTDPAVGETLAELQAGPGGDRLVGIRHQVHDEPDRGWLGRRDVRRGLAAVARVGLSYDLLIRPREMPAATDAARAIPELRFVVDHLAKPAISTGVVEPWAGRLRDLGSLDNVACKLSGLVTEAAWDRWTVDDLGPYVDRALAVFGAHRLLFGSDWPVCLVAASYETVVATARTLVSGLSAPEQDAVFAGTAERFYRLAT